MNTDIKIPTTGRTNHAAKPDSQLQGAWLEVFGLADHVAWLRSYSVTCVTYVT